MRESKFLCSDATLAGRTHTLLTYRRDLREHAAIYVVSMETRTGRQNINEYLEKWPAPELAVGIVICERSLHVMWPRSLPTLAQHEISRLERAHPRRVKYSTTASNN